MRCKVGEPVKVTLWIEDNLDFPDVQFAAVVGRDLGVVVTDWTVEHE